jgi:hypothetical protein
MESSYKPEGYNSVSPYLVVNGADATKMTYGESPMAEQTPPELKDRILF